MKKLIFPIAALAIAPFAASKQFNISLPQLPNSGDVVKVITAPVTVPVEAGRRVINGEDPAGAVTDVQNTAGNVARAALEAAQSVEAQVRQGQRGLIERNLGRSWADAFDVLQANDRIRNEMAYAGGRTAVACMQGQPCTANQLAAFAVAAMLRDAYRQYHPYAQRLSPELQLLLAGTVPDSVLTYARVVAGNVPSTLPGFLNAGHQIAGAGHAVTVADIIIFDRMPDTKNWNDVKWLLHELKHVGQYLAMGRSAPEAIDRFAYQYVQHHDSIERDAENTARAWIAQVWDEDLPGL